MASTVLPNGIIIPEKYSRDWYNDLYHNWQELDNLLGGGTPKDGTLTIQKNGATVGTFSANQATDETINITVPTNTSDLTNDSNFVQSSDLATVATSGSYNDLTDTPTIPTVNNATLTIQKNGTNVQTFTANQSTNATANITVPTKTSDLTNDSGFITSDNTKIPLAGSNAISGDLIPSTDGTVNLGGSSYQWNNAYIKSLTINGVACGDILTHNVSEFVDVTSMQTIGGVKKFSDIPIVVNGKSYVSKINANRTDGTQTGFSAYNGFKIVCNNDSQGWDNTVFAVHIPEYSPTRATVGFKLYDCIEGSSSYKGFGFSKIDNDYQLFPTTSNAINLGTSTNKWKSFNGINPGALSLPSGTYITLDTTNFDVTATTIGTFTPTADGWAILSMSQKNKHFGIWMISGAYRAAFHSVYHNSDYMIFALIPVRANVTMAVYCTADDIDSTRKIDWIRLFPCQGNV